MISDPVVRIAGLPDAVHIAAIYTESVKARDSTMDLETVTSEAAADLIRNLRSRETVFVCEQDEKVLGWGIVKLYSKRPGYGRACETSVYVYRDRTGVGIGSRIQTELLNYATEHGFHHVVTKIWADNHESISFHEKFGFTLVGIQQEIGYVDGENKDIAIMQYILSSGD